LEHGSWVWARIVQTFPITSKQARDVETLKEGTMAMGEERKNTEEREWRKEGGT
jgi:hypothetical protein